MNKKNIIILSFILFSLITSIISANAIIVADHNAVDQFDQIPDYWINESKKLLIGMPGQSHSTGLWEGLPLLQAQNSKYAVDVSVQPDPDTNQYLRFTRGYYSGSSWADVAGEEQMFTSQAAINLIDNALNYSQSIGNPYDAFGFGWCWDMCSGQPLDYNAQGWAGRLFTSFDRSTFTDYWDINTTVPNMNTYLTVWNNYQQKHPGTKMIYSTGPVDTDCSGNSVVAVQREFKHTAIRNWVNNSSDRVLFDYADILSYNNSGQCNRTWVDSGGIFGTVGKSYTFPVICNDNLNPVFSGTHISQAGTIRLSKAMWWFAARLAGWPGVNGTSNQSNQTGICEATGSGKCYYVAPNGNDANNGSFNAPYKTFRPALVRVVAGDFIYARGGIYDSDNTMPYVYDYGNGNNFIAIEDWGSQGYYVNSGTAGQPITVRNYPGEQPILNSTGISLIAIELWHKQYWTIQGFEIIGGAISIGSGSIAAPNHDIIIRDNDIHDLDAGAEGDNHGNILIVSETSGASYNIFIHNNTFHDTYRAGLNWANMEDPWHTGALTIMGGCAYHPSVADCTANSYVEFVNNTVYNIPQSVFFKNAKAGPVLVKDNIFYNSRAINAEHSGSNILFVHNLFYNISSGIMTCNEWTNSNLRDYCGMNITFENNTFVGLKYGLLSVTSGINHKIKNNIFFGINGSMLGADSETPAYITKSQFFTDDSDPAKSLLQNITSDNNCFILPITNALFVKRKSPSGYYNRTTAYQTFNFDGNSVFITQSDPTQIFIDPANRNYHLINPNICPGMGYYANGTAPQNQTICTEPYNNYRCDCINITELSNTITGWNTGQININQLITNIKIWKTCSS